MLLDRDTWVEVRPELGPHKPAGVGTASVGLTGSWLCGTNVFRTLESSKAPAPLVEAVSATTFLRHNRKGGWLVKRQKTAERQRQRPEPGEGERGILGNRRR